MTTTNSYLTEVTVYLTPPAKAALEASAKRCGDSRADTINRALLFYGRETRVSVRSLLRAGALTASTSAAFIVPLRLVLPDGLVWSFAAFAAGLALGIKAARWLEGRPR